MLILHYGSNLTVHNMARPDYYLVFFFWLILCTHLVSLSHSRQDIESAIKTNMCFFQMLGTWALRENPALPVTLMFFPLNSTAQFDLRGRGVMQGSQWALYDSDVSNSGSGHTALLIWVMLQGKLLCTCHCCSIVQSLVTVTEIR